MTGQDILLDQHGRALGQRGGLGHRSVGLALGGRHREILYFRTSFEVSSLDCSIFCVDITSTHQGMWSATVGEVTSTKVTLLGSTSFSTSHFTNSTCRNAVSPGAPTFLPTKSFGSLMVMPLRTKAVMLPFDTGLITVAPAIATRSRPPSAACRNTVEVGPPIWIEFDRIAAGIFELIPIGVISTSSPCFLKMPSSTATMAEAQSEVAVQPTWILACAAAAPVSAKLIARVATIFFNAVSP